MRNYINQFYNEGFATSFYLKPLNYLNKKIKNKKLFKFISVVIGIFYTILVLIFAGIMFYRKFPLW